MLTPNAAATVDPSRDLKSLLTRYASRYRCEQTAIDDLAERTLCAFLAEPLAYPDSDINRALFRTMHKIVKADPGFEGNSAER